MKWSQCRHGAAVGRDDKAGVDREATRGLDPEQPPQPPGFVAAVPVDASPPFSALFFNGPRREAFARAEVLR